MSLTLVATAPKASAPLGKASPVSIGIFHSDRGLTQKQVCILHEMARSLTAEFLRTCIVPVITQRSRVSLRALDWAVRGRRDPGDPWEGTHRKHRRGTQVTNYCKKRHVNLVTKNDTINVHNEYKQALTHYRCVCLPQGLPRLATGVCYRGLPQGFRGLPQLTSVATPWSAV